MPKRVATPPPADDTRYFTVVNPFPHLPQLGTEDSKKVAQWIACIIGQDNLYAFYHKPTSPNVVIIEVPKDGFFDLRLLLGEHRWREFLKTPGEKSANEVSRIFPCKMATQRSLEKVMWLRKDVRSSWFRNWAPEKDSTFVYPYPRSYFCTPPADKDISRNPLCRPLPSDLFHDNATKPVSGSAARSAAVTTAATYLNRSTPIFLSDALDMETDSQSEEWLPNFPGLAPPGLASPTTRFVPAIHGADVPKSKYVVENAGDTEDSQKLWVGYGEADEPSDPEQCEVHGILCPKGVCRVRSRRKREEEIEKRLKKMREEKEIRIRRQERRREKDNWTLSFHSSSDLDVETSTSEVADDDDAASSAGSTRSEKDTSAKRLRDDIPLTTIKGQVIRKSSSPGARTSATKPEAKPLPPHLRKGAQKAVNRAAAATSLISTPASSRPSSSASSDIVTIDASSLAVVRSTPEVVRRGQSQTVIDSKMAMNILQSRLQGQIKPHARRRWADIVDEDEGEGVSQSDVDDEDALDAGLPRGVTVIPAVRVQVPEDDNESILSDWSDAEPF